MTTVACWFNSELPEYPAVWMAADGKLSTASGGELLGTAIKILSLPVNYYSSESKEQGFFDKVVWQTSLGYAYAGSALAALNTHAFMAMMLSRVNVLALPNCSPQERREGYRMTEHGVPALQAIADATAEFLKTTVRQLSVTGGPNARCEIALSGWCPVNEEMQVYRLRTILCPDGFGVSVEQFTARTTSKDWVLLLGDAEEQVRETIEHLKPLYAERANEFPFDKPSRLPLAAILHTVAHPPKQSIGGYPQLGIGMPHGFSPARMQAVRWESNSLDHLSAAGPERLGSGPWLAILSPLTMLVDSELAIAERMAEFCTSGHSSSPLQHGLT